MNFNYTWSHALVDGGSPCEPFIAPQDLGFGSEAQVPAIPCYYDNPGTPASPIAITSPKNRFGVGNSGEDVHDRGRVDDNVLNAVREIADGVAGILLKGWGANAAGSWQTGLPFTAGMAGNQNATGTPTTGNPNQVCSGRLFEPDSDPMVQCLYVFTLQQSTVQLGLKHTF